MAVEFRYDNESIEYTGYRCAYYKFIEPGDFRDDISKLRAEYEKERYVVLHVLTCYNNGIDWYSGRRVKEDEHGFEVIYKESE